MNLSSEVSAMFNSLMPSLNIRSLPFVVFLGGFPSRCQNLSSGAIRPGGLLLQYTELTQSPTTTYESPGLPKATGRGRGGGGGVLAETDGGSFVALILIIYNFCSLSNEY